MTATTWRVLSLALPLILFGCAAEVTHRQTVPFSKGHLELVVSSVGGALGEERYELKFQNQGEPRTFFRGANFSEFNVAERGGKLAIQMCRGLIDHAEPIGISSGDTFQLVRLDLDWNCKEKSREV